jgi:SAM-dependent methyltransferase
MDSHRSYYDDKIDLLRDLFGTKEVRVEPCRIEVDGRTFPVLDDVIILLEPRQYTASVRKRLSLPGPRGGEPGAFARDVQSTFGAEWKRYGDALSEHELEFRRYFDLIDLDGLRNRRACDLGCGAGRWSRFLKDKVRELILVDFSDAIFKARAKLSGAHNCLFFMEDLKRLPFRENFCDFLFSLGVLHHLPTPCLEEVRALRKYASRLLVYLYYALDNRPSYFSPLLKAVTGCRTLLSRFRHPDFRELVSFLGAILVYKPLVSLGRALQPFGLGRHVPLYDIYKDKGLKRIEQDVYDRFFTPVEQRVTRKEILALSDSFSKVTVSDRIPYWHFLCER